MLRRAFRAWLARYPEHNNLTEREARHAFAGCVSLVAFILAVVIVGGVCALTGR